MRAGQRSINNYRRPRHQATASTDYAITSYSNSAALSRHTPFNKHLCFIGTKDTQSVPACRQDYDCNSCPIVPPRGLLIQTELRLSSSNEFSPKDDQLHQTFTSLRSWDISNTRSNELRKLARITFHFISFFYSSPFHECIYSFLGVPRRF